MSDFPITIFHNPACGTSRNVLAAIRTAGHEPEVVEYMKSGWTADQLRDLLKAVGLTAHDILRKKSVPADMPGLLDAGVSEDDLIRAMVEYPVLVERPIVATPKGAVVARPVERVFEVLDRRPG